MRGGDAAVTGSAEPSGPEGSAGPAAGSAAGGGGGDRQGGRRMRPVTLAKLGFLAAVVAAGAVFVASRWDELSEALSRMSWVAVAASLPVGVLGLSLTMLTWRAMLADLGSPLRPRDAARVFFTAQLGKYLPGSVWSVLAQVELARELKVPRRTSFAVSVLSILMSMAVGLTVAAALLPLGAGEAVRRYWWVVLVIPALLALLDPRVAAGTANLMLRVLRREPLPVRPTYRGNLRAAVWATLAWLTLGLHAWLLVVGAGAAPGRSLPVAVGGFTLAFCLGVLFIPAPAGAGIRDVALTVALSGVLTGPEAATVAIVSRVVLALGDFALAGLWSGVLLGRRVAPADTAG